MSNEVLGNLCHQIDSISMRYSVPGLCVRNFRRGINELILCAARGDFATTTLPGSREREWRRTKFGLIPWIRVEFPNGGDTYCIPPNFLFAQALKRPAFRVAVNTFLANKDVHLDTKGVYANNLHGATLRGHPRIRQKNFVPVQFYMDDVTPTNSLVGRQVDENLCCIYYTVDIDICPSFSKFAEANIMPFAILKKADSTVENVDLVLDALRREFDVLQSVGIGSRNLDIDDDHPALYPTILHCDIRRVCFGLSVLAGDNPAKAKACGCKQQGSARKQCWFCDASFPSTRVPPRYRINPLLFDHRTVRTDESIQLLLEFAREKNFVQVCVTPPL
jgi:hypothetical protein